MLRRPVVDLFADYTRDSSYSPNLSSPHFNLFPKLKELLHENCFGCLDDLSQALAREICHLNKD